MTSQSFVLSQRGRYCGNFEATALKICPFVYNWSAFQQFRRCLPRGFALGPKQAGAASVSLRLRQLSLIRMRRWGSVVMISQSFVLTQRGRYCGNFEATALKICPFASNWSAFQQFRRCLARGFALGPKEAGAASVSLRLRQLSLIRM